MKPPASGRPVRAEDWDKLINRVPEPPASVSVIVIHYEQPRQLARTLLALARQRYRGELEVIVIDDGSRRPPHVPPHVQLIRQTRDGPRRSAARNRGVQASRGQVLCFLDADTVPEPDYVAQLTRLPALAPEAVTVGLRRYARLEQVESEAEIAAAGPAHELPAPGWLRDGYVSTHNLRDSGPRAFRFVISAVLGCTRWFYDEVGGFDESFDAYGGEDWEWAHRAWLAGAAFAHIPQAVAWHDGPDWAGRQAQAVDVASVRAEKNHEAMRLARLITAPGHRPRGLLAHRAETLIQFSTQLSPAETFVCVDSLLEALPRSVVLIPDEHADQYSDDPRVLGMAERGADRASWPALHILVHAACTVTGAGLAHLGQAMLERDGGVSRLGDDRGELMTVVTSRHRAGVARWGPGFGGVAAELHPEWLQRLTGPADVEAYLGGWDRSF